MKYFFSNFVHTQNESLLLRSFRRCISFIMETFFTFVGFIYKPWLMVHEKKYFKVLLIKLKKWISCLFIDEINLFQNSLRKSLMVKVWPSNPWYSMKWFIITSCDMTHAIYYPNFRAQNIIRNEWMPLKI